MNFRRRAENLVGSVLAERLHGSDLFTLLVHRVECGLRQAAKDARRQALRQSANAILEGSRAGEQIVSDRTTRRECANTVLALERRHRG